MTLVVTYLGWLGHLGQLGANLGYEMNSAKSLLPDLYRPLPPTGPGCNKNRILAVVEFGQGARFLDLRAFPETRVGGQMINPIYSLGLL